MITCEELVDFFLAWHEGTLPAEVRAEFERHLKACPPCEDYLESYETAIKLGHLCSEMQRAEPVPEPLIQAILAARAKDPDPEEK